MKIPSHVRDSEEWKKLSHKRRCRYGAALSGLTTGMIFTFSPYIDEDSGYGPDSVRARFRNLLLTDVCVKHGELMIVCRALGTGDSIEYSWGFFKSSKIVVHTRP